MTAPARFRAQLDIVGVNPFVFVPDEVLAAVLAAAGRERGPVPVRGTLDGAPFRQTLVRFQGHWRLYVNTSMLRTRRGGWARSSRSSWSTTRSHARWRRPRRSCAR